jgi:hypothetical protein
MPRERVAAALKKEPGASDRRLGELAHVSAITAKKCRAHLAESEQVS